MRDGFGADAGGQQVRCWVGLRWKTPAEKAQLAED
jgi:hypothetical protein